MHILDSTSCGFLQTTVVSCLMLERVSVCAGAECPSRSARRLDGKGLAGGERPGGVGHHRPGEGPPDARARAHRLGGTDLSAVLGQNTILG